MHNNQKLSVWKTICFLPVFFFTAGMLMICANGPPDVFLATWNSSETVSRSIRPATEISNIEREMPTLYCRKEEKLIN